MARQGLPDMSGFPIKELLEELMQRVHKLLETNNAQERNQLLQEIKQIRKYVDDKLND
jgi:gas vesicle protein